MNWNQEELAKASGVSRTYISDVERGKITNVGTEIVFALAEALGVSVQYILGLTEDPLAEDDHDLKKLTDPAGAFITGDRIAELVAAFQTLPEDDQQYLLKQVRILRDANIPRIIGEQ